MSANTISIKPVSNGLGAEILGIDLREPLDSETHSILKTAYSDYGVIFFRDQNLTPEQHIAFAENWGNININRFFQAVDNYPMIAMVNKEPDQTMNIGSNWHTDHSYDQIPALGSALYAREVPEIGGDTMFANPAAAYEALSDGLKQTLEGLNAVHTSRHAFGAQSQYAKDIGFGSPEKATQDAVHPVVISHPFSGKKVLYVNPGFTQHFENWSMEESKPLLDFLYQHIVKPEFTCRFKWQKGSMAFWDNRSTWHYALNDYHGYKRLMHRITIEGVPLER